MENPAQKRPSTGSDSPEDSKRFRPSAEIPGTYSDAVRKKLQSATRTGQACDRCKERKMRCDANPLGCGPCSQKNLRCVTTDRITGRPFERGQSDRVEVELLALRRHVAAYVQRYGPLDDADLAAAGNYQGLPTSSGYASVHNDQAQQIQLLEQYTNQDPNRSGSKLGPHRGPINGTKVDIIDGEIDIADFECPDMDPIDIRGRNIFTNSRSSSMRTICGVQKPEKPQLPAKEKALEYVKFFMNVISPYVPVLHGPTFVELIHKYYDDPNFQATPAEIVMIVVVLAIISYQMAVRNPSMAEDKMKESNQLYHYGLTFYVDLFNDSDLPSMQALALYLIHSRNLPKPGASWNFGVIFLSRAIELGYHRSPTRFPTPETQNLDPLTLELRKRVFWTIFGVVVTTGCKLGRPMPLRLEDIDVELPIALEDSEISETGMSLSRSGKCNFWGAIQLYKLLPLLMDLYNNVISVRRPSAEYVRTVETLSAKINEWRRGWNRDIAVEENDGKMEVATHLIDTWAAEFELVMYHPRLFTGNSPEMMEKNLDICHNSSMRLLRNLQALFNRFKGADFTWHSTVSYVLAAGTTLHIYNRRKDQITPERFKVMQHELNDWLKIMIGADQVLRTGELFIRSFKPLVEKLLNDAQNVLIATSALQSGYRQDRPTQQEDPPSIPHTQAPTTQYPISEPYSNTSYPDPITNPMPTTSAAPSSQAYPQASPNPQQYSEPYHYHPTNPVAPSTNTAYAPGPSTYSSATQQYQQAEGRLMNPAGPDAIYAGYPPGQNQHADALISLSQAGVMDDATAAAAMWPNVILLASQQHSQHSQHSQQDQQGGI